MAAQVGVVAAFQSSDQLFAVEILAGALQAFDQPASADGGRGQFVFLERRRDAVKGDQLKLATVDAAGLVPLFEIGFVGLPHVQTIGAIRAGKGSRDAERAGGDAVLGPAKRSEGNCANGSLLRSTGKTTKK